MIYALLRLFAIQVKIIFITTIHFTVTVDFGMSLNSEILFSFGYLMDTGKGQLRDSGRNSTLSLLKGANHGKRMVTIWMLYLSLLGNNF